MTQPDRTQLAERLGEQVKDERPAEAVRTHLGMMTDRYVATTSVQRMAEHLRLIGRLDETRVATQLFHHPDLGSSDLVVVTRDTPGLFALIAGTLASQGINIISAQIATRADGIAIDTFQVNEPTGEAITSRAQWSRTLEALRAVLAEEQSMDALLDRRGERLGLPPQSAPAPPKIAVSNQLSDTDTVIEVKCPDRVGLLYQITRTLSSLGLDISSARIATEIDQAFDTFYVHDRSGMKLVEPDETERARAALEQALRQPI